MLNNVYLILHMHALLYVNEGLKERKARCLGCDKYYVDRC